jgi:hypothetical protein
VAFVALFPAGAGLVTTWGKRDSTHGPLCAFLRSIHWPYRDVSRHAGFGCDIVTRHKDGYPMLVEFKREGPPSSRVLTDSEKALRDMFPLFYAVVQTREELMVAIGLPL